MTTPVKYVGLPDGPEVFVPEFGCAVKTFNEPAGGKRPALKWHVPLEYRGDFRPQDLANYDPQKSYRTDALGKVLCYAYTQAGERCCKRATNRYPKCDQHGSRLHPMDKLVRDEEKAANESEQQALSRYRQFIAGQLSVDDLEDEELAACGFRAKNGSIFKPRNVPREMATAFTRAIYERAQSELRSLTVEAAQTMGEIMKNKNVEPDIRLKAALSIIERNLGKTPQVLAITDAKAYEEVFDGIVTLTREQSRAARQLESGRDSAIDAEIVSDEQFDVVEADGDANDPNANGNKTIQQPTTGTPSTESRIDIEQPQQKATLGDSRSNGYSSDGKYKGSINDCTSPLGTVCKDGQCPFHFGESERLTDARLYERNEAILAPVIEIKPFEYDLSNHTDAIKKETQKRYAKRAFENTPDVPLLLSKSEVNVDGYVLRVHCEIDPLNLPKAKTPSKSQAAQRKSYTLSDF